MSKEQTSIQKAMKMSRDGKQQLLRAIKQAAHDNEALYWGCSQAVLSALQKHLNLGNGEAFKAASALAGGVCRSWEVCGALLGGVMAIGLAYGRANYEVGKICLEQTEYQEAMLRGKKLCEKFQEKFGSLRCADVASLVRGTDYKYPRYNTLERLENHARCGYVTGLTAQFAAEVILEPTKSFEADITSLLEDIKEDLDQVRKKQVNLNSAPVGN